MLKLGVQDDPLMFLITDTKLHVYKKSRLFRICFLSIYFYQVAVIFASLFFIFYWDESAIFMKLRYIPFAGISSTAALSNLITILGHHILLSFPKIVKENAWCLKSGGEETFARIAKSCGYIKILHISAYVIIFVCVFSICPLSQHDKIWQGGLSLIDEYISNSLFKPLFTILYYLLFTSSVYSFIVNLNSSNYILCHIIFQHHILNHYVISLVKMSMQNSDRVGYQEEIYRKIITLVRIKERTRKFCNMMLVYADYAAMPLTVIAIEQLVCVAAFIIFEVRPESNIRLSLSFAPVVIFAVNLCSNGQRAKDESENVYNNALKCGWYNWNTRNRRAYLMFLISNMKPVRFSRSGVYDVDYPLFVFIWRTGYTLFTLFINMSGRRKKF